MYPTDDLVHIRWHIRRVRLSDSELQESVCLSAIPPPVCVLYVRENSRSHSRVVDNQTRTNVVTQTDSASHFSQKIRRVCIQLEGDWWTRHDGWIVNSHLLTTTKVHGQDHHAVFICRIQHDIQSG